MPRTFWPDNPIVLYSQLLITLHPEYRTNFIFNLFLVEGSLCFYFYIFWSNYRFMYYNKLHMKYCIVIVGSFNNVFWKDYPIDYSPAGVIDWSSSASSFPCIVSHFVYICSLLCWPLVLFCTFTSWCVDFLYCEFDQWYRGVYLFYYCYMYIYTELYVYSQTCPNGHLK